MERNATLVYALKSEDLLALLEELKREISELKEMVSQEKPLELYSRKEMSEIFKCDPCTIHNWTKKGYLFPVWYR